MAALFAAAFIVTATSANADQGVTDTTIRIGMFGPMTGAQSAWGTPVHDGALMVYQDANAKGGINGRKIEVVQEDGGCDAAPTVAAVKKLIFEDKVFMINGGICSGPTMAARPEVTDNKVPMMLFAATLDAITTPVSRYVFTAAPTGRYDGTSMGTFIKSIPNVKRVAIVSHPDDWAKAKRDGLTSVLAGTGIQVVADETLDKNVTEATAQVLAIKRANPDVVVLLTYPGPSAAFLRDAYKYNLRTPFVGNNSLIDLNALAERVGTPDALKTLYVTSAMVGPLGSADLAPYQDLLKKYYPNDTAKMDSFYGTASAIVVVEALKRAGRDLTREKFVDALDGIHDFNTGIAPCPINLSASNHQGCQSQTIWALRDGKVVNIGPTWKHS